MPNRRYNTFQHAHAGEVKLTPKKVVRGFVVSVVAGMLLQSVFSHDMSSATEQPLTESRDFMAVVAEHADSAMSIDNTSPANIPHPCGFELNIDASTAPDMTTPQGWLEATNKLRALYNRSPLSLEPNLQTSSHEAALQLTERDEFRHTELTESAGSFVPDWQVLGENIGVADVSEEANLNQIKTFVCFADSSSHLRNILNPTYTDMGVALGLPYPEDGRQGEHVSLDVVHFAKLPQ